MQRAYIKFIILAFSSEAMKEKFHAEGLRSGMELAIARWHDADWQRHGCADSGTAAVRTESKTARHGRGFEWSLEEHRALVKGVAKYGVGKWAVIKVGPRPVQWSH